MTPQMIARHTPPGEPKFWPLPPIEPYRELGAYEALWMRSGMWFDRMAKLFPQDRDLLPTDYVAEDEADATARRAVDALAAAGISNFGVRINGAAEYPARLRDAANPLPFLYFRGIWELTSLPSVAIVGARAATPDGLRRASRLARLLVGKGIVVVSGLARGIDTAAHTAALAAGGHTIAVTGTPLDEVYPRENADLARHIADEQLLISQVPVLRYHAQTWRENRLFFPERNVTMSALTQATVIVEAGETSGSLTQARAALKQGRRLFILESCFGNPALTWPRKYEARGAIRVRDFDDILWYLNVPSTADRHAQP